MPSYRLVFTDAGEHKPIRSIAFSAEDARDALRFAQNHDGPTELWSEDKLILTLDRVGEDHAVWLISGRSCEAAVTTFQAIPSSDV